MDPISQGIIGSTASQVITKKKHSLFLVALIGLLSGLAPDLDIFIRSSDDPLLFLEFHRQFTHSLVFIPFGGLICGAFIFLIVKKISTLTFKETYIYSTIGYATHGLLDACTSYGTLLFWPFSYERISWNNISIIDPIFTIPVIIFVGLSAYFGKKTFAVIAIIWAISYLIYGAIMNQKALEIGKEIAKERGHKVSRIVAKPTFANSFLWKIIYESEDTFYTDGVRILPSKKIYYGESTSKLNIDRDYPFLNNKSQQYKDIERFAWFSDNYLAIDAENKSRVFDIRYSMLPNQISGLWGIEIDYDGNDKKHIKYVTNRSLSQRRFIELLDMIFND